VDMAVPLFRIHNQNASTRITVVLRRDERRVKLPLTGSGSQVFR